MNPHLHRCSSRFRISRPTSLSTSRPGSLRECRQACIYARWSKPRQRRQDEINNDESSRETRVRVGSGRQCQWRHHTKIGFFSHSFPQASVYNVVPHFISYRFCTTCLQRAYPARKLGYRTIEHALLEQFLPKRGCPNKYMVQWACGLSSRFHAYWPVMSHWAVNACSNLETQNSD